MAGQFVVRTGSDRREPVRGGCGVGYLHLAGKLYQAISAWLAGYLNLSQAGAEAGWRGRTTGLFRAGHPETLAIALRGADLEPTEPSCQLSEVDGLKGPPVT